MMRSTLTSMPGRSARGLLHHGAEFAFGVEADLFRNHAAVHAERDQVRHHVGVDAALDQADVQRGGVDARHLALARGQFGAQAVDRLQDVRGGLDRVHAGVRHGGVALLALDRDFHVQAAVVRRRDAVREAGRDCVVGLGQAFVEQELRTDVAAGFLVIGELQFDGAVQLRALLLGFISASTA
jgi:hypothetical protein